MNGQHALGPERRSGGAGSGQDEAGCAGALAPVLAAAAGVPPGNWPSVIQRAYAVAAHWHRGQRRKSGEPHISHPVQVARILAVAGADPPLLCAALLHDLPADTGCTLAMLRQEFGAEIAGLVEQVTRLDRLDIAAAAALAAGGPGWDSRALMLKLADRLHNMRTVRYLAPAKQQRKSREVIDAFVPLARALGMPDMERELAERAAAVLAAPDLGGTRSAAGPAAGGASRRMLALTALLLPGRARGRWLEEWTGELATLPSRRSRARFALSMLAGMPAMAITLRRPSPAGAGQR